MKGIIYCVTNKINKKCYIGQTTKTLSERKYRHEYYAKKEEGFYLHSALLKYGFNNFNWETIDDADNINDLNLMEQEYILLYNSIAPNGYNLNSGGLNYTVSDETRQKLSISSSRQGKGVLSPNYGKIRSKDSRNKLSDSRVKMGLFGFTGGYYKNKNNNPWRRVWVSRIRNKHYMQTLGYFEDPLSCEILYKLVKEEIYGKN